MKKFKIYQTNERLAFLFTPIVVKGFTTGLAFYIGTSQLRSMLGISKQLVQKPTGIGGLFVTWYQICANLPTSNVSSVGIAIVTVAVCYATKILSIKYKTKLRNFPIPGELLTVSGTWYISNYILMWTGTFQTNLNSNDNILLVLEGQSKWSRSSRKYSKRINEASVD